MKNFLDQWIENKIGIKNGTLSRKKIEEYQLKKIKEIISYAKENSSFYNNHLNLNFNIDALEDFEKIPFTYPKDCGEKLVCIPQKEISRIVTLQTSGSAGNPKRVFFTKEDQELTVDFFHNGMKNLIEKKDRLLILMPCKTPGSVGDLLKLGVERIGTFVFPFGMLLDEKDYIKAVEIIKKEKITAIVAIPSQFNQLLDYCKDIEISAVLLSAEYVSDEIIKKNESVLKCKLFQHYGMTESGLGGAVSCYQLEGYHPREADLYYEIIDNESGKVVPDGEWGEITFTTLTRKAMPFIRYRTGDIGRFIDAPCPCGSKLKRLDRVMDRGIKKGGSFNG